MSVRKMKKTHSSCQLLRYSSYMMTEVEHRKEHISTNSLDLTLPRKQKDIVK